MAMQPKKVARGINNDGGIASAASADVTSEEDMKEMAAIAIERHGSLDILCANAGIYPQTKLEDMTVEEWDSVLATNLKGNFLSVKACLPHNEGQ